MKKRIGNDIQFTWHIYRKSGESQTPESFDGKEVEVKLISPLQRPVTIEDVSIATGVVTFTFRGKHQVTLGNYVAVLQENRGEDGMVTLDVVNAVTLVAHSYMEEDGDEGDVIEATSVELESEITAGGGSFVQQQADWEQDDDTQVDYIKNKPDVYKKDEIDENFVKKMLSNDAGSFSFFTPGATTMQRVGEQGVVESMSTYTADGWSVNSPSGHISTRQGTIIKGLIGAGATPVVWQDTATEQIPVATTSANGLMSAADKQKITDIEAVIPEQASSSNQLVDMDCMNSSIATATATFRGAYNLVTDLHLSVSATHAQIATALATAIQTADNNDYCYVQIPVADDTPTEFASVERYKFNGTAWEYEYALNNSGFTAAQWAAINSGITSGLVAKLSALPTNSELITLLNGKANTADLASVATSGNYNDLTDKPAVDNTPTPDSDNLVKSGSVFDISYAFKKIYSYIKSNSKAIDINGNIVNATLSGALVATYPVIGGVYYRISGYSPSNTGRLMAAFYNENGELIDEGGAIQAGSLDQAASVVCKSPSNAVSIRIFDIDMNHIMLEECLDNKDVEGEINNINHDIYTLYKRWNIEGVTKNIEPVSYETSDYGRSVQKTGALVQDSSNFYRYVTLNLQQDWDFLYFKGILSVSPAVSGYSFYDINGTPIEPSAYDNNKELSEIEAKDYRVAIPSGAVTFRTNIVIGNIASGYPIVNENNFYLFASKRGGKTLNEHIEELIDDALNRHDGILSPISENFGKAVTSEGQFIQASSVGAVCNEYVVEEYKKYCISGFSPADNNSNHTVSIVCKDSNDNVLAYYKPCRSAGFQNFILDTPSSCVKMIVFGTDTQTPYVQEYQITQDNIAIDSIPMLYNSIDYRPLKNNTIKILCFGSSWFMTTWWYLNKLLGETGVDSELHCYYMGHAKMREWVALYNNDLTPFSGSEASRRASKNISVNGSDWIISNYSSGGSYDAQSYRNDFYNDIINGDWDIIAIQQGAQECIIRSEWEAGLALVELVKSNCSPRTTVALNSTWTHALGYSGNYFSQISRLADGKLYFQQLNNRNTRWFMYKTGISNISPNGAMLSLMRSDNTLNISNDMADDGLHPNNGLPILGLAGCFYETFIAPLVGTSFIELNWLPTISTQKALVSGSSFQECNTELLATIKRYVKKALSNRFIFYT